MGVIKPAIKATQQGGNKAWITGPRVSSIVRRRISHCTQGLQLPCSPGAGGAGAARANRQPSRHRSEVKETLQVSRPVWLKQPPSGRAVAGSRCDRQVTWRPRKWGRRFLSLILSLMWCVMWSRSSTFIYRFLQSEVGEKTLFSLVVCFYKANSYKTVWVPLYEQLSPSNKKYYIHFPKQMLMK